MRQIILDTETTGLDPGEHRIIEIGCIELVDRRRTRNVFHHYLNPERPVDAGAVAVHGLTDAFLADKPRFAELSAALLEFLTGAELVIHNAPFDVGFLDAEFRRLDPRWQGISSRCAVIDTLQLARERHPGQRNSLDALCKRYQVDNSGRDLHGARLDATLLCEVYLSMTGGQGELLGEGTATPQVKAGMLLKREWPRPLAVIGVPGASREAHRSRLNAIGQRHSAEPLWLVEAGPEER
jgi:DNA polymerase III subunit epsilon